MSHSAYQHLGCVPASLFAKLAQSYTEPSKIEGYDDLKEADKEKLQRAWDAGAIPEDDKGPGEPVEGLKTKRAPAKKAAKDEDKEPPKKRARRTKVMPL